MPSLGPFDGSPPREEARAVDEGPGLAGVDVGDPPVRGLRIGHVVEKPSPSEGGDDQLPGRRPLERVEDPDDVLGDLQTQRLPT